MDLKTLITVGGTILAATIASWSAFRQFQIKPIYEERIKWLNEIEDKLAKFIAIGDKLVKWEELRDWGKEEIKQDIIVELHQFSELANYVYFRPTNPEEFKRFRKLIRRYADTTYEFINVKQDVNADDNAIERIKNRYKTEKDALQTEIPEMLRKVWKEDISKYERVTLMDYLNPFGKTIFPWILAVLVSLGAVVYFLVVWMRTHGLG